MSLWDGGDPEGRAVLFFHGCPDSRLAAVPGDDAARAARVRLVAVSRPGYSMTEVPHGDGAPVTGQEHLEVAADTAEVADLLGIGDFAVLGMSVGGPYAVATASRFPERVRALAVVEAPADVTRLGAAGHRDDLDERARTFYASLATMPADQAAERLRPEYESWVAGIDPADPDDAALAARWLASLPPADASIVAEAGVTAVARSAREATERAGGYLRDATVTFRAWPFDPTAVSCPVLAWYGDGDDTYSPRNGEWYADALGATYTLTEGATHLGMLLRHWPELLAAL